MLLKFKLKRDINGNIKTLIIDTNKKTLYRSYNPFSSCDYIEIKAKDRNKLINDFIEEGYKEIY